SANGTARRVPDRWSVWDAARRRRGGHSIGSTPIRSHGTTLDTLITQRSQVQILSPLPLEAPSQRTPLGGRFRRYVLVRLASVLRQQWEEVACHLAQYADDALGRQFGPGIIEFGGQPYAQLPGFGDDGGSDAFAEGAQALADDLRIHRPRGHGMRLHGCP